jgi:outer membrane protein W
LRRDGARRLVVVHGPTAALGVEESRRALELILGVDTRGLPIILISHDKPHVFEVADRNHVHRLGRRLGVTDPRKQTISEAAPMMAKRSLRRSSRPPEPGACCKFVSYPQVRDRIAINHLHNLRFFHHPCVKASHIAGESRGGTLMGIRGNLAWLCRGACVAAGVLAVTAAAAADYPTKKAPPPAPAPAPAPVVTPVLSGFFVKAGFLYAINQSSSTVYSQTPSVSGGFGPQIPVSGVNAKISNVATLGVEAGYYVMPNVSIDVSGAIPMWANNKTKGTPSCPFQFPPSPFPCPIPGVSQPLPPNGTLLGKFVPAFVPITVLYHFTQFGAFQPYLGGGFAPVFSFRQKNEFETNVTVDPTVGVVLQAGADYMIDQHWGWTFDVKKAFADGKAKSTGDNLAAIGLPGGQVANAATQKTRFEPWTLATGLVYRF